MIQLSWAASPDKGHDKDDVRVALIGFSPSEEW